MANELQVDITSTSSSTSVVTSQEAVELAEIDLVIPVTTTTVGSVTQDDIAVDVSVPSTSVTTNVSEEDPLAIEVDVTATTPSVIINVSSASDPVPPALPAISTDPDNRARYGSDMGVFVPQYEDLMDPIAYYILAKS